MNKWVLNAYQQTRHTFNTVYNSTRLKMKLKDVCTLQFSVSDITDAEHVRRYKDLSGRCNLLSTYTSFPSPKSMNAMPWKRMLEVTSMYSLSANSEYTANTYRSFMLNASNNFILCICWCFWPPSPTACFSATNLVRYDTCLYNCTVDRRLVVSFCSQPHYCYRPHCLPAWFQPTSLHTVSAELLLDRSGSTSCISTFYTNGALPVN